VRLRRLVIRSSFGTSSLRILGVAYFEYKSVGPSQWHITLSRPFTMELELFVYKLLLVLSLEFDVVEIKGFQDVVG